MLIRGADRHSMWKHSCVYLALSVVSAVLLVGDSVAAPNLRGVAPQDENYFQTGTIRCRDGSKSFPQERLNDNYCDCVDGTDEPGTNACPESKFYCKNLGHRSVILYSSRVNDGICDCCDGSDEYDGKVTCANTCGKAGAVAMEKLKKKLGVFKEGSRVRKQDVENAKKLRRQHEEELIPLRREEKKLSSVVDKLKTDKEAVEKEEKRIREEKERLEKEERERKERESPPVGEESQEAGEVTGELEDQAETSDELEDQAETSDELEELEQGEESEHSETTDAGGVDTIPASSDPEADELAELSAEERGRIIASRWTGEDVSDIKAKGEKEADEPLDEKDDSEADDETGNLHDDEEDEDYPRFSPQESSMPIGAQSMGGDASWWSKLMIGPSAILKMFGLSSRPPVDISEAEKIRREFREASDNLQSTQSKITDLENRLKQDFGKDGEFYSFYDRCFELKDKKYTYKVCPYKDATQMEGHLTTRLGRWQGFKEDYTNMIFEQGDKCWNGPERSLRVKMRCGSKLELRSVDEPSRCEYVAEFSTPALCLDSRVKLLERQLSDQEPFLDPSHDEL